MMYYKIELRIEDKYYSDGTIKIEDGVFEGFLTNDYIQGIYFENNNTKRKILKISVKCMQYTEEEIKSFILQFQIDDFYLPGNYETIMLVAQEDDETGETFEDELLVTVKFIKKIPKKNMLNFDKTLEQVKKGLKL